MFIVGKLQVACSNPIYAVFTVRLLIEVPHTNTSQLISNNHWPHKCTQDQLQPKQMLVKIYQSMGMKAVDLNKMRDISLGI